MKKAKFALKCAGTLAVTGICAAALFSAGSGAAAEGSDTSRVTTKKIQPHTLMINEENADAPKKEITAMEAPDFEETIKKMRRLSPEEIDEMYERFKNDIAE